MSGMYHWSARVWPPGGLVILPAKGGFQPYLAVAAVAISPPSAEPDPPAMEGAVEALRS
jgi:hypothetical protein